MQNHCQATRHLRAPIPLLCAALIVAALGALPAYAVGTVGTGTPGSCTQGALNIALVGGGLIKFNCGLNPHTIVLTLTKTIVADTTIDGGNLITLKASNVSHFAVAAGRKLELVNLRLTNGKAPDKGGAVFNRGTLVAQNCAFSLNTAVNGGGAIWNDGGTVDVKASSFDQNQATDFNSFGGAIGSSAAATLTITNSTFNDNSAGNGGALGNNGIASAKLSTFFGNVALNLGGAIYNSNNLTVDHSTLTGNQAGSAGGGLTHQGVLLTLTASTVNGNLASQGGGLYVSGQATFTNSTLSGNQATDGGGGLYHNSGDAIMRFMTIADNFAAFGAGEFNKAGDVSLQNTVLSNNTSGNCDGLKPTSLGNNLSSDTHCAFTLPSDRAGVDAKLGPLADNGGPTLTHLPQASSPAINGAVMIPGITTDQRDVKRPRGPLPDIGAVEAQ
jgi:polymorphic membrane protein